MRPLFLRFARSLAAFAMLVIPSVAAAEQSVDVQVKDKALLGTDKPGMRIVALADLRAVEARITSCDGRTRAMKIGSMRSGDGRETPLDHAPGHCAWKIEVRYAGATDPEVFQFETVIARPMELRISKDTVDLADGRIAFVATEPVAKVALKILGESGKMLLNEDQAVSSAAGATTTVTFAAPTENVTLVKLTAYDPNGFFNGVEISPFFVEIPHEEITFDTGKADIHPDEEGKLQNTLASIRAALKKFGNEFRARLYVAGYTDTVGGREYNQELSDRRAMSVAHWFASHGLEVRVCAQGFGEDALAVQTPDETPEARNRRTLYVLGNQAPPVSATFPRANWRCL